MTIGGRDKTTAKRTKGMRQIYIYKYILYYIVPCKTEVCSGPDDVTVASSQSLMPAAVVDDRPCRGLVSSYHVARRCYSVYCTSRTESQMGANCPRQPKHPRWRRLFSGPGEPAPLWITPRLHFREMGWPCAVAKGPLAT